LNSGISRFHLAFDGEDEPCGFWTLTARAAWSYGAVKRAIDGPASLPLPRSV